MEDVVVEKILCYIKIKLMDECLYFSVNTKKQ